MTVCGTTDAEPTAPVEEMAAAGWSEAVSEVCGGPHKRTTLGTC